MNKYKFFFFRKGTKLGTEVINAVSVVEACKKADEILKTSKRRYDDWEMENKSRKGHSYDV